MDRSGEGSQGPEMTNNWNYDSFQEDSTATTASTALNAVAQDSQYGLDSEFLFHMSHFQPGSFSEEQQFAEALSSVYTYHDPSDRSGGSASTFSPQSGSISVSEASWSQRSHESPQSAIVASFFIYLNSSSNADIRPPNDQLEKITIPERTRFEFCKVIAEHSNVNHLRVLSGTFVLSNGHQIEINDANVAHLPPAIVIRVGFAELYSTSEESHQRISALRARLGTDVPILAPGREKYSALRLIVYL